MANYESSNNGYTLRLTVTEGDYNLNDNTSPVSWSLTLIATSYNYFSNWSFPATVNINGEQVYSSSEYRSIAKNGTLTIASGTKTIEHNSDGTKSISCSASIGATGASYMPGNISVSGTLALTTIPRKSILWAADGRIGLTDVVFTIDRKSSSFRDSLYYVNPSNNSEVLIVNKTSSTTYSWSPPTSLYQYFPNSNKIYLTFKSYTYNGNTLVGSDTAHAYIYANTTECEPTLSVTVTPTNYSSLTGDAKTIIKGVSNVSISATATAKNSATISNVKTNGTALTLSNSTYSKTLQKVETGKFTTIATDSRGITKTDINGGASEFTVVPYIPLTISANVYRTNQTSSTIKVVLSGKYFDGNFGSQSNTLTLSWKCRNSTSDSYKTGATTFTVTKSNGQYQSAETTLTAPSGISFDYDKPIFFEFKAVDKIKTGGVTATPTVDKGEPIFDYGVDSNGKNYFNVNGYFYGLCATTGQEIGTNEYVDGEQVFRKRINLGTLPDTTTKSVSTGLTPSNINIIRMQGASKATNGTQIALPHASPNAQNSVSVALSSTGNIDVTSGINRTEYTQSYIDLYYIKVSS